MSLRIEWKKIQSQGVSFVYYNSEFTGTVLQTDGWLNMSFSSIAIDSFLGNSTRKMTEEGS